MNEKRKKTLLALYAAIVALVLFVGASYAWMSISTSTTVSDLTLNVVTDNKFEIAQDENGVAGDWSTKINFLSLPEGSVLKPVTFSAAKGAFYAPRYAFDGRTDFSDPILLGSDGKDSSSATADAESLYLISYDFWLRSEANDCVVYLKPTVDRSETGIPSGGTYVIGKPEWNADKICHEDVGNGANYAIRLAFYVHPTTVMDEEQEGYFVIYEPNCDGGKAQTALSTDKDEDGNALPYEGDYKLIRQTTSTWSEQDPVLRDNVDYEVGEFIKEDEDLSILELEGGVARKVTLYIWLEGQDKDCSNAISNGVILASIQFTAGTTSDIRPGRKKVGE